MFKNIMNEEGKSKENVESHSFPNPLQDSQLRAGFKSADNNLTTDAILKD